MRFLKNFAQFVILMAAAALATPAMAQAPNAFPITNVNLRAGPGTQYPVILTVPADAPITILGCLPDYTWCDSVFENYRGWMRSIYLSGYSEGDYYLLRDYAPDLGYQPVTFNIDAYWDSYYRDEPFYGERGRWERPYDEGYVDEAVFYDRLSPHGSWTWIQGRYVWVPSRVERDWRPYTRGRWVYTDRGWTWVSNEPFGWATYHYGRWGFSDRVGWFWVPGNRWAPAWVSWRQSDDYLAWAPLPPSYDGGYERGYDRGGGININISFGDVPDYYWSVVPSRDFLSDDLPRYYVHDRGRRRSAFDRTRPVGHTTIVNKTVVNNVVNVNYVEQKTKKKVVKRRIARTENVEAAGKVEGDTIEVYEPKPDETPEAVAPPEPKDVETVAEASETKGQAEGEATTEDMLAPKEVQEAVKERKGRKGRKAEAQAEAKGEGGLPEGEIADAPPPPKVTAKEKPVPAHEVAAPKAEEAAPEEPAPAAKQEAPKTEPKEPKETPEAKDPEPSPEKEPATKTPEPDTSKPDTSKPERGAKEKPAAPEPKSEDTPKKEKPLEKKPSPAGKAQEPAETKDGTPPAPKEEMPPKEERPAETQKPEPLAEPEAKEVEPKEPEAKKPEPKEPEAKEKPKPEPEVKEPEAKAPAPKEPEVKKPEPKEPEAKKPAPKEAPKKPEVKAQEPKKAPEPKKPEAKKPAPKPEAKKAAPKPEAKKSAPKPEAKKPAPKPEAKKPAPKPEAKKPAPKKQEARRPEPKAPQAKKHEAKKPAAAKQKDRRAQAPDAKGKAPAKGKKKDGKNKE